jgi:hypothetical protein
MFSKQLNTEEYTKWISNVCAWNLKRKLKMIIL